MSFSFKQLQDMLQSSLRAVGSDIDAQQQELNKLRKELSVLKIVNLQVLQNQTSLMEALNEHGIKTVFTPVTTIDGTVGGQGSSDGLNTQGAE